MVADLVHGAHHGNVAHAGLHAPLQERVVLGKVLEVRRVVVHEAVSPGKVQHGVGHVVAPKLEVKDVAHPLAQQRVREPGRDKPPRVDLDTVVQQTLDHSPADVPVGASYQDPHRLPFPYPE